MAPELLTWRVRSWGVGLAFDAVADGQVGVGVAGSGLGELLAEGVEGAAAAGCGGGVEPDVQRVPGDVQVAGEGERLPEQGLRSSSSSRASGRTWCRGRWLGVARLVPAATVSSSRAAASAVPAAGSTGALAPLPGRRARPAASSIASDSVVSAPCTLPRAVSTAVFAAAFAGLGTGRVGSSAVSA